jgi:hypothetical protein
MYVGMKEAVLRKRHCDTNYHTHIFTIVYHSVDDSPRYRLYVPHVDSFRRVASLSNKSSE